MIKKLLFSSISIFISLITYNQVVSSDVPFVNYSSEDGLSQQVVRSIIQDTKGFIWIGTEDGLNKFDGYDFKHFRNIRNDKSSLPDNFIYALCPSKDGGVWIGTNNSGLSKYNSINDSFTNYPYNPEIPGSIGGSRIYVIKEGDDGIVWVGTYDGGLSKFNPKTKKFVNYKADGEPSSIASNMVVGIQKSNDGNLWVRTNQALQKFNIATEIFTTMNAPIAMPYLDMRGSFFIDANDVIWTSIGHDLLKFDIKTEQHELISFSNFLDESLIVLYIAPLNDNYLWISSYRHGLFLFNKNTNEVVNFVHDNSNANSIIPGCINTLLQDNSGSLWIGGNVSGLSKLNINRKKFSHYKHKVNDSLSISGNTIRALLVDSKNNIWVGLDGIANSILDKLTYNNFDSKYIREDVGLSHIHSSSSTTCLLEDSNKNIWIGTWGDGVHILPAGDTIGKFELNVESETPLGDNVIQAFLEDSWGNIWIGTEIGLDLYNPQTGMIRNFLHDPNNRNSLAQYGVQANTIVEDSYGGIWVGTWGGLTRMMPREKNTNSFDVGYKFIRYQNEPENENSISDNRIISLYYNKDLSPNEIYAGTYGSGLNRIQFNTTDIDSNKIHIYTRFDGLPNDVVYGILSDNSSKIWISTNDGLSKFNPETEEFINYDANDGLQGNQFFWGARAKGLNGELLFGGVNGFSLFNPEDILNDQTRPLVAFTDLKVLNKSVKVGEKVNKHIILKKGVNWSKKITLTHRENVFTIEFSGLHYAFPKNNRYKYMLEGFDEDWIEVDSRKRFASYTNLDPGNYTFKVYASNYDGVWSEEPSELKIYIKPSIWKRLWFKLFILLMLAYAAYNYYKKRTNKINRDKNILEEKIKEGEILINEKIKEVELQQENINKRNVAEQEMRFMNNGLAKFSDILAAENDNLKQLSNTIISELVKYVGASMGVVYVFQDNNEGGILERYGSYAFDDSNSNKETFHIGEGYVGTCFQEGETILVNDIPEDYSKLSSGLGTILPTNLSFITIALHTNKQGVIELASLKPLEDYKIKLIEKVGENINSIISIQKAGEKMNSMLEQSQQQTENLRSQEEEMRQNMEEMAATQEEMERQMEEQEEIQNELNTSKSLLDAILNTLPDYIYFKDLKSKFIKISKSMLPLFPVESIDKMIGKSDFDFQKKSDAEEYFNEEQEIIETRKGFINKEIKEEIKGIEKYVSITKMPLIDKNGKCLGTYGISKDISERFKYKMQVNELKKELKKLKDKKN